ncbi:MAG: hypothetical protein ACLSGS_00260 [Adlercreutzia sp.]
MSFRPYHLDPLDYERKASGLSLASSVRRHPGIVLAAVVGSALWFAPLKCELFRVMPAIAVAFPFYVANTKARRPSRRRST